MNRDTGEGAFNFRKQELSLDLRPTTLPPVMTMPPNNELIREKEARAQYAQGFFDALRGLHSINNFDFDVKNTLASPSENIFKDILSPTNTQLTPTTTGDIQAILAAIVSTPQSALPVPSPFPGPFSIISGSSMTEFKSAFPTSTDVSSTSTVSSRNCTTDNLQAKFLSKLDDERKEPAIDLTGYHSEDSVDNISERSRSSSVALSHGKDMKEMTVDEQEQKKLERKRARNRAAASKCRQKKMDKIAELENQVNTEKQRGQNLDMELQRLRQTLAQLEQLMESQRLCRT